MSNNTSTQRYIPQSPKPHSPPQTPSPTSPVKTQSSLTVQSLDVKHVSSQLSASLSLDTPATTPEDSSTPLHTATSTSFPSSSSSSSSSSRPQLERTSSQLSGMGITFPPDANPLPAELSEGQNDGSSSTPATNDMARSFSDGSATQHQHQHLGSAPMTSTWSASAASGSGSGSSRPFPSSNGYGDLHPNVPRPRSISPGPFANNGFASSISYNGPPGSDHRPRIVSPTRGGFHDKGSNEQLPTLNTDANHTINALLEQSSPAWSPAIDGKKEPSIKYPFGYEPYDPSVYANPHAIARNRSPYPSGSFSTPNEKYTGHPLSGQAYNHPTRDSSKGPTNFYDSTGFWLGLYFFLNMGLTLFNKIVLAGYPFPYTLTGLHALSGCAGCYFALERGAFVPARLTSKENLILAAFSVLYTINIAVSNISLQLVTLPFHQVVRASTPLFTIIISAVLLRTRSSTIKVVSLLPIVAGVGFATYGDYDFTAWGLILTLLGTFLAALKTVVTNLIQIGGGQRLKLHPLDLLMRMSPLAFIQCVIFGWYTGELERVRRYGATQMTQKKAIALLVNGIIACGLNIVSFTANKKAGPLTMTVSANCKQVMTIALSVFLFNLHISPTNGVGILLTLIGGGWYGYVEYSEKKRKSLKLVDRS